MQQQKNPRVLVVDDEERFRLNMVKLLGLRGYPTAGAADGREALEILSREAFDVVVLDLKMPGMNGAEVLAAMRAQGCDAEVLVLTGHASMDLAMDLMRAGVCDYLLKPCPLDDLTAKIESAFEHACALKAVEPRG